MSTKINQFISVTGASADTARKLLNACAGNLELAIDMYMEDGALSSETGASNVDRSPISIPDEDGVRPPILPVQGVLVEDEPPTGRFRRRKRNLPSSIFDPFRDVASEMQSATNNAASKKRATLSELYRPPLELLFQGNFTEAKEAGSALKKWLLVNVQDAREFSSHILNRDVWHNAKVKSAVQNSFLLWQTYRGADEASKFCQFYAVYSFPFVAILDPRTGEFVDQWKGNTSKSFLEFASEFLSTHSLGGDEPSIPQPKKSRIEKESACIIDLSEEDQLEAAIAASISQKSNGTMSDCSGTDDDFVLVESDEEDGPRSKYHADHDNNSNHSKSDTPANLDPSRLAYLNMTKNLPSNKSLKEGKGKGSARRNTEKNLPLQKLTISDSSAVSDSVSPSENNVHLLLRLPTGTRVECSFKENHPVQELFDIVAAQDLNVEEVEIIANFPRRVITMVNCLQSFTDVGLKSRETVFVQIT